MANATTKVESLVGLLQDDIRRRRLRPGDRYMTAAEASEQFAASSMSVDRAMRKLAAKNLLVRHKSRGTFVGPSAVNDRERPHPFEVVHLLLVLDAYDSLSFSTDEVVDAVRAAFPEVAVQVHCVPVANSDAYVQKTLERLSDSDDHEGLLLFLCPRQIQHLVERSNVSAAIFGHAYPGINLPWADHDQRNTGHTLGRLVLQRGFRRCTLVTRSVWRYGDNLMVDALAEELSRGGFSLNDLQTRSVSLDQATIDAVVEDTLTRSSSPAVFVCRNIRYANAVLKSVNRRGLQLGEDLTIVSGGSTTADSGCRFPHVAAVLPFREQIAQVGTLLCESAEKRPVRNIMLPVSLQEANCE